VNVIWRNVIMPSREAVLARETMAGPRPFLFHRSCNRKEIFAGAQCRWKKPGVGLGDVARGKPALEVELSEPTGPLKMSRRRHCWSVRGINFQMQRTPLICRCKMDLGAVRAVSADSFVLFRKEIR